MLGWLDFGNYLSRNNKDYIMNKIRLTYQGSLDTGVETKLTKALSEVGYSSVASGYSVLKDIRDICFEKKTQSPRAGVH